jgi:hypothetical protein
MTYESMMYEMRKYLDKLDAMDKRVKDLEASKAIVIVQPETQKEEEVWHTAEVVDGPKRPTIGIPDFLKDL